MTRSIYVIRAQPGPVKVGIATKPKSRLCFLQVAAFVPLSLEFIGECLAENSAGEIEARAHEILKEKCQHGEWFAVSVDEAVEAVNKAAHELGHPIKSIPVPVPRPKGKRPGTIVKVRFSSQTLSELEGWRLKETPELNFHDAIIECASRALVDWRAHQRPIPSRPEAIRQLAEIGLKRGGK